MQAACGFGALVYAHVHPSANNKTVCTCAGWICPWVRDVAPFGARPGVPYPSRLAGMIDEDDCRAAVSLASGMSTSA
eukprot:5014076-Prymnesium_polylepis.1